MKILFILLINFVVGVGVLSAQERFIYNHNNKRDPFLQLVTPTGVVSNYETDYIVSDLILEGIVMGVDGSGGNVAIINGKIVKVNDIVGQFTVIKIEAQAVTLMKDDQIFVLKLKKEE